MLLADLRTVPFFLALSVAASAAAAVSAVFRCGTTDPSWHLAQSAANQLVLAFAPTRNDLRFLRPYLLLASSVVALAVFAAAVNPGRSRLLRSEASFAALKTVPSRWALHGRKRAFFPTAQRLGSNGTISGIIFFFPLQLVQVLQAPPSALYLTPVLPFSG